MLDTILSSNDIKMPGSIFCDMSDTVSSGSLSSRNVVQNALNSNTFEEQRALQLAFELSMIGLNDPASNSNNVVDNDVSSTMMSNNFVENDVSASMMPSNFVVPEESRSKKSQNMTECVPVPSSEHVAEIVGRQGCKIKALRAKTNTYIKTPVRGEEPVFVVTGRKEDVAKAKREILSAAEHFSQIRASRKNNPTGTGLSPPGPPANVPGHVTIQVRVPYRVVGLVVGPKGATIKRIQHLTHTYIVTPSRDKEPVFDVTGLPESVEAAKREIESHIAARTGTTSTDPLFGGSDNFLSNTPPNVLNDLYKTGLGSLFNYMDNLLTTNDNNTTSNAITDVSSAFTNSSGCSSASSASSACGGGTATNLGDLGSIWGTSMERDEGIGESPSFDTATAPSSIWSFPQTARPSPPQSTSPTESVTGKRDCIVCGDKEVTAVLVPCGHNLFCMDCGERISQSTDSACPVCNMPALQAVRIIC
ncbi:RNA-binding protein MEX3B-like [Nilaparvata lugens]|uniref:RNA-binding protein MEX3B-like n=1 Tax=Nilaparvata lugens TaxID=108931 RepID=UPI00193CB76C|nr:RNA-binding protein MEX3B-like [Nilaparvata lugens]